MWSDVVLFLGVISFLSALLLVWVRVFNSSLVKVHRHFLHLGLWFDRLDFSSNMVEGKFSSYLSATEQDEKDRTLLEFLYAFEDFNGRFRRDSGSWEHQFFVDQLMRDLAMELCSEDCLSAARKLHRIADIVFLREDSVVEPLENGDRS